MPAAPFVDAILLIPYFMVCEYQGLLLGYTFILLTISPTQPSIEINHPFVISKTSLFCTSVLPLAWMISYGYIKMLCILGITG